jgi:hypothetical protein
MSDTTNDTSAIDDKKKDSSTTQSESFASDVYSFITTLISLIIAILVYFSFSGLILFACKLAQSNILPTEYNCYPYTESKPTIQPIKTNIFTTFTDQEMSMKMEFPYDDLNSSNKILDMFRNYKNKPNSHFLANYLISIVEKLINFNYSAINTIMNTLNGFPEMLIVALGPIIVGFSSLFILIINLLYTCYLWFANMGWFFKKNTNDTGDGLPSWEDIGLTSPVDWGFGVGLIILFTIIFFLGFIFIPLFAFTALSYCFLTCLFYKSIMNGKKTTTGTIIKELLKYYKLTIVCIISFFVVSLAFSKLGPVPGIFSIITLGLIYWGILSIDLFKPILETNLSPSVSYDQAKKKCNFTKSKGENQGLLSNLFGGQNGGNIAKELKKINKNLSSN